MRLGTRGSALALAQAGLMAEALDGAEVVPLRTADGEVGDKERFVRGIEQALLAGEVDLAVHSAKDLPGELPDGLRLAGVPRREDPADAFVGSASSIDEIPAGARIGTSSLRRRAALLALRPDLEVAELRGNVDTRLKKLAAGDYEGIVLALAGLRRLGREAEASFTFEIEELTPAPGQGTLALEARSSDSSAQEVAATLTEHDALVELTAERAAVGFLQASCHTPVGICGRLSDSELTVHGFAALPDGSEWLRDQVAGDSDQPAALGDALADRMLAAGAGDILERAEQAAG